MVFWKSRKHKLPKFPPEAAAIFHELCTPFELDQIEILRVAVNKHFEKEIAADHSGTNFDPNEAREIQQACNDLLDIYPHYPKNLQALIIGAVRYAAASDDPFCDRTFASGLDDDKRIVNYVFESLNLEGHYLKIY